jgi:dTDP-4-amino-4,6-dideoxygalactose transaminase
VIPRQNDAPRVPWHPRLRRGIAARALASHPLPVPVDGPRVRFYHRGANAIWCGLGALRLGSGDSILFPAYHCGTELDPIVRRQIAVRLYPVDDQLAPDPAGIRAAIDRHTRALFITHYLGVPQDLDALAALCREAGLWLIEDCAHSLHSTLRGRPTGTAGDLAIFSFRKTLPVPDGGALVVNNPALPLPPEPLAPPWGGSLWWIKQQAEYALEARSGFLARNLSHLLSSVPGSTSSPHPLHIDLARASWGISPLARRIFPAIDATHVVAARRDHYARLAQLIDGVPGVTVFCRKLPDGACPWLFAILVNDPLALETHLLAHGIEGGELWKEEHPAVDHTPFGNVRHLRRHMAALPIHQDLTPDDLSRIADIVADWATR